MVIWVTRNVSFDFFFLSAFVVLCHLHTSIVLVVLYIILDSVCACDVLVFEIVLTICSLAWEGPTERVASYR